MSERLPGVNNKEGFWDQKFLGINRRWAAGLALLLAVGIMA